MKLWNAEKVPTRVTANAALSFFSIYFHWSVWFLYLVSVPCRTFSISFSLPHPLECLQLICIVAQRVGLAVIVVVMVEGFSHQLFPLLQLNQNTSVLLPVMSWPRNCSKSCFPGKPHIRKSRRFFSPSLFDCYSRAAWKRLWGFWLGSHPLLAEEATVNPLNSNAKAAWLLICLSPPQICIKAIK